MWHFALYCITTIAVTHTGVTSQNVCFRPVSNIYSLCGENTSFTTLLSFLGDFLFIMWFIAVPLSSFSLTLINVTFKKYSVHQLFEHLWWDKKVTIGVLGKNKPQFLPFLGPSRCRCLGSRGRLGWLGSLPHCPFVTRPHAGAGGTGMPRLSPGWHRRTMRRYTAQRKGGLSNSSCSVVPKSSPQDAFPCSKILDAAQELISESSSSKIRCY